ncbi:MAG: tryptophan--tRNA ligase [Rickettsiaceae bacterium]|nr:tryptophan--tRNA ligase [Rickettsiaceae bacterium]
MNKKIALTGDRPTGKLHLGHYFGSLVNRLKLQSNSEISQLIMVADAQALTDNSSDTSIVRKNITEVVKDYLAVGIDPNISTIFLQSYISELAEITFYYLNLVNLGRLERNPTVKTEILQKNFRGEIPLGFLCYPVSQAADITAFKAELVPVGEDQLPMIEQTNEIVRKFNRLYDSDCLRECTALLSENTRLQGLDGKAKMSKSLNNAIYLSDDTATIKEKIFAMYTDPEHIKISDPGKVEGNVVFSYLDIFYPNKEHLDELKTHYKKGGLGDVKLKNMLNDEMQSFLQPIREKRNNISDKHALDILRSGSVSARKIAAQTLDEIKVALGIGNII